MKSLYIYVILILFCFVGNVYATDICGTTITENTTLDADQDCDCIPAFTIGGTDVVLDGAGYKVYGNILISGSGATIKRITKMPLKEKIWYSRKWKFRAMNYTILLKTEAAQKNLLNILKKMSRRNDVEPIVYSSGNTPPWIGVGGYWLSANLDKLPVLAGSSDWEYFLSSVEEEHPMMPYAGTIHHCDDCDCDINGWSTADGNQTARTLKDSSWWWQDKGWVLLNIGWGADKMLCAPFAKGKNTDSLSWTSCPDGISDWRYPHANGSESPTPALFYPIPYGSPPLSLLYIEDDDIMNLNAVSQIVRRHSTFSWNHIFFNNEEYAPSGLPSKRSHSLGEFAPNGLISWGISYTQGKKEWNDYSMLRTKHGVNYDNTNVPSNWQNGAVTVMARGQNTWSENYFWWEPFEDGVAVDAFSATFPECTQLWYKNPDSILIGSAGSAYYPDPIEDNFDNGVGYIYSYNGGYAPRNRAYGVGAKVYGNHNTESFSTPLVSSMFSNIVYNRFRDPDYAWNKYDCMAALFQGAHNYRMFKAFPSRYDNAGPFWLGDFDFDLNEPELGNSTPTGGGGYGLANLQASLALELTDLDLFPPVDLTANINTSTLDITLYCQPFLQTARDHEVISVHTSEPTWETHPSDGTVIYDAEAGVEMVPMDIEKVCEQTYLDRTIVVQYEASNAHTTTADYIGAEPLVWQRASEEYGDCPCDTEEWGHDWTDGTTGNTYYFVFWTVDDDFVAGSVEADHHSYCNESCILEITLP